MKPNLLVAAVALIYRIVENRRWEWYAKRPSAFEGSVRRRVVDDQDMSVILCQCRIDPAQDSLNRLFGVIRDDEDKYTF